jgi:hypothetical protein
MVVVADGTEALVRGLSERSAGGPERTVSPR